ncbi:hypothetical protein [Vulcanisaeta sp. JCM 16161]
MRRARVLRVSRRFLITLGNGVREGSLVRVTILLLGSNEVVKFVARVFRDGNSRVVRLPASVRRAYGVQPLDEVVVLGVEELSSESTSSSSLATAQPLSVSRS